jgi:HAE1 family hydrophobic/amphiphilic exporter-1
VTLPELAIRRPVTALMLITSMVALGSVALTRLPLAFLPDLEQPEMFVRLPYPTASPEQVEWLVVRPVEEALASVRGLRRMWSRSNSEGGMVRLEFDWGVNLQPARVEVWEKLDRIRRELPEDLGDIIVSDSWSTRESDDPILECRLSSARNLSESYDLLERRIVRPLQRVPGVAQVRLDGVNPREVRVNLRLADLELHGVEVRDVSRLLRSSNFDQSLGKVTAGEQRFALRTLGAFEDVEEIRDLPLRADGLRLRHVADVVYEEPRLDFGRHLDGHFAVGITVSAESRANSVTVCEALEERIARMGDDPELEGLKFLVWFSQGKEIKKTLLELLFTGVFGAAFASLVLFAFLRRFSTTFISLSCIPFSLIVACGMIWAQGSTLNTLSLLGLIVGVGMLVDNAVVVMENIFRHQELGLDRRTAARLGSREVSTAVIAATLTSVIVFLPVVFNKPSEMNIHFKEIGLTVCITLLASLFISQTLIPLATSWFIRARPRPKERWIVRLEEGYTSLLALVLERRWLAPLFALAIAASAIHPFLAVDRNFDSTRTELYAQVHYQFSEETTVENKQKIVSRVEAHLEPHREELVAKSIYSWWSTGFTMTRVYLRDGEANQKNIALVRDRLRRLLPEIPGVKLEVGEHRRSWRQDRGKRVAVQLLGEDPEVLGGLAEEVRRRLERIEGLGESFPRVQEGQQELHIVPQRERAGRYRLSGAELAETVGLSFRGRRLPRFRTPSGEREMRLTLDEKETASLSQLYNLPLRTPEGGKLPLAAVVDFHERRGAERIERDHRLTSLWVGAEYKQGRREQYIPLVARELEAMEFPFGYSWTFGSWEARRQEKSQEFLVNLLLSLLCVFAVMASLFESVSRALALMLALPFALAGASWALFLTKTDFDQPAAVGLLLLIGIVVNNGIVLLEHIHTYQRSGMPRREAMLRGGRERLRPILMTALTTVIGLTPMVVQRPSLGGMYYYSMALVIMGGMIVSTFLTAVLLPPAAALVEDGVAGARRLGKAGGRRLRAVLGRPGLA